MEKVVQISSVTPEELVREIVKLVEERFKSFKKEFQPKDDELLTRKEAARLFKVDESTIFNWNRKGKIKKYMMGARAYYKKQEILSSMVVIDNAE